MSYPFSKRCVIKECLREHSLPAPVRRGVGIFTVQSVGQLDATPAFGHLSRMSYVMEVDEPLNPTAMGRLGPAAVMTGTQCFAQEIEKFR